MLEIKGLNERRETYNHQMIEKCKILFNGSTRYVFGIYLYRSPNWKLLTLTVLTVIRVKFLIQNQGFISQRGHEN